MSADDAVAWRSLLAEATERLGQAGLPSPSLDARRLVECASGAEPDEFPFVLDEPATQRGVAHFDAMLDRRVRGEPLQYVLGGWSFRSLDLFVDRRVLIPRPETETVVECALAELDRRPEHDGPLLVADLGTGSGAIALAIAQERTGVEVWATDASSDAIDIASGNLAGLGRVGTRVRLAVGSWFDALPASLRGRLDMLVSNPPYVADDEDLPAEVADWEPHAALRAGPIGTEALVTIIDGAGAWLVPSGSLVLELAPGQAAAMADRARAAGFVDVVVAPDLTGRDRVLIARTRVSAGSTS